MDAWSWAAFGGLLVAVMVVSWGLFSPAHALPAWTHRHDKCWHTLAFAGLALLTHGALSGAAPVGLLWLGLSALGLLTEVLQQWFAPGRSFSWGDALANAVGAAVGLQISVPLWTMVRSWG